MEAGKKYVEVLLKKMGGSLDLMSFIETDMSMSKTEMTILLMIYLTPELKVSDVGEGLSLPMSTTTFLVDKLVKKGLIQRTRSDEDRRVVTLSVTEEGVKLSEKIFGILDNLLKNMWNSILNFLDEEEKKVMERVIKKIASMIG